MDFTAIDFETANEQRDSACQLGAVVVRGGDIVRRHCWLIRPRPMRFSRTHIAIHGITPELVREEPDFGELWESIRQVVSGQVLVAHNARFDIGVLQACMSRYGLAALDLEFSCTRAVGHYAWPGQPGYGLKAIASRLGISFQHHDALEDALACAKILLAAADEHAVTSLDELEKQLRITRGCGSLGLRWAPQPRSAEPRGRIPRLWPATELELAHQRGVEFRISFRIEFGGQSGTGRLPAAASAAGRRRFAAAACLAAATFGGVPRVAAAGCREPGVGGKDRRLHRVAELFRARDEAERLVAAAGGTICRSVTRQTDLLVVGRPDSRTLRAGRSRSTKEDRAEELRAAGQELRIVSEREFLQALGGPEDWVPEAWVNPQKLA